MVGHRGPPAEGGGLILFRDLPGTVGAGCSGAKKRRGASYLCEMGINEIIAVGGMKQKAE